MFRIIFFRFRSSIFIIPQFLKSLSKSFQKLFSFKNHKKNKNVLFDVFIKYII